MGTPAIDQKLWTLERRQLLFTANAENLRLSHAGGAHWQKSDQFLAEWFADEFAQFLDALGVVNASDQRGVGAKSSWWVALGQVRPLRTPVPVRIREHQDFIPP